MQNTTFEEGLVHVHLREKGFVLPSIRTFHALQLNDVFPNLCCCGTLSALKKCDISPNQ
jgi:hypothetical protein